MSSEKTSNSVDLVIRAGRLLTMRPGAAPINDMEVHIKDGKIAAIEPSEEGASHSSVETIDARGCLVMPGLINAHTHAAMTLFRGLADDMPLKQWLFEKIFPAEAEYLSPHNVYWSAMLAFGEMISSGTTCFSDGYFFQDKTFDAAIKVGIRGVIGQGVIDFPAPGVPDPEKNLDVGTKFIERWKGFSSLLTPSLFCHSPVTCSEKTLIGAMEICDSGGVPMQIHLSETLEEVNTIMGQKGIRPAYYLDRIGILKESLIAVHCVHLEDEEIRLLKERGTRVVHCPESNMKLASGVCAAEKIINAGIPLGLGTDGCASNNDLDMLREMDSAAKLSKVSSGAPTSLKAEVILRCATIEGARALGLDQEIGSIEIGKRADIIVVDLDKPHLQPLYDPISSIVYSANGGDVRDVIVEGKVLMRERKLLTVDMEEVMWNIKKIAKQIQG